MAALALIADAALLLVILRMIWVGADRSCPREFFFLLSLLCYASLSYAPSFPVWGHATLAFFALPMLLQVTSGEWRVAKQRIPSALLRASAAIVCLLVATAFGAGAVARWGNSEAARWALLGSLLELAAGIVLVASTLRHFDSATLRLRFFIGVHLLLVNLAAFIGVPFYTTVFAATFVWLLTAAAIAPRPDALVNPAKLAVSGFRLQVAGSDPSTLRPCNFSTEVTK